MACQSGTVRKRVIIMIMLNFTRPQPFGRERGVLELLRSHLFVCLCCRFLKVGADAAPLDRRSLSRQWRDAPPAFLALRERMRSFVRDLLRFQVK